MTAFEADATLGLARSLAQPVDPASEHHPARGILFVVDDDRRSGAVLVATCIRKGLGLKAHGVAAVREDGEMIVAEIERMGRRRLRCGGCGGGAQQTAGRRPGRRWRDLRLRDRPLVLAYAPYRVRCRRCGVRVEQVPWAARRARVTTPLARAVAALARKLSWAEVAAHFGLDWKTVAAIIREAVATGLRLRRWRPLHVLGIDEVSRAKGQT